MSVENPSAIERSGRSWSAKSSTFMMEVSAFPFHFESKRDVRAPADVIFSYLDNHARLAAHMSQSSWMMAGARMAIELDESEGRTVGSRIRLRGRVLGIPLSVEEAVTERQPPLRKIWQTTGVPKLLVIGHYRMGFEITPQSASSSLRIFIDYAVPETPPARWLARLFGGSYARWCTESMADDAVRHFA
jgi:hypothetical protein